MVYYIFHSKKTSTSPSGANAIKHPSYFSLLSCIDSESQMTQQEHSAEIISKPTPKNIPPVTSPPGPYTRILCVRNIFIKFPSMFNCLLVLSSPTNLRNDNIYSRA